MPREGQFSAAVDTHPLADADAGATVVAWTPNATVSATNRPVIIFRSFLMRFTFFGDKIRRPSAVS